MFGRSRRATVLVVYLSCLVAASAHAQTDRGTITGQVTDQQAAIIPNAAVKAIHVATNFERQVTTSSEGSYTGRRHQHEPVEQVQYQARSQSNELGSARVPPPLGRSARHSPEWRPYRRPG